MSNEVDTSTETVNAEFDAAEMDIGPEENLSEKEPLPPEPDPLAEAQKAAEIAMATGVITTSLNLVVGMFSGVSVDEKLTHQAAESYAILIIKYFPGGLFSLLDRYKEELTAATATLILVKAIADAKEEKEAKDEAERKAKTDKKPAPPETTPPTSTTGANLDG